MKAGLSSEDEVQHPCRFDIGRLIKTLGSVAMRCYSHLSDDEREQILAKALGHSIGAIAQAIGRPKSKISRELSRNKLPRTGKAARSARRILMSGFDGCPTLCKTLPKADRCWTSPELRMLRTAQALRLDPMLRDRDYGRCGCAIRRPRRTANPLQTSYGGWESGSAANKRGINAGSLLRSPR
jgi:hypothetical protein